MNMCVFKVLCLFFCLAFLPAYLSTQRLRSRNTLWTSQHKLLPHNKVSSTSRELLILRKSFYATSSCPVCWDGHSIPSVLRASSSPCCACLGLLLTLSHLVCDRPKRGKWVAQSKVPGTEQALSKRGDRFSWAFRKPAPQCNVQIIVLVTSNDTCHSSAAPTTTVPLHPFLFRICTAAMSQSLTIPQSPKPIL